ncbi:chemotaxis protein CheW [Halothermothrix orenii]|uniref:Chemotaxis protein CheW n=1 Tax=Halothermothrix orenii (strain H 168 / OCM 544 / DSM 9562) TaxID=373903 RepID=B8D0R9_HALOH|nr:chemotaxis protein CheW [Halothermothrix orenii]ACL71005.1 putative CheW protein [Halothermothrix orenii H 168]
MSGEARGKQDNTLDILNQQLTSISAENQFLTFKIEEEEYGVDVLRVQEIIRYHEPTKIPNTPDIIKGVINFRGEVIPVIDLRKKFGFPYREYDNFTVIIVLEVREKILGIIVDQVSDILSFSSEDIQRTLEFSSDINVEFIDGMAKLDERLIMLLKLDMLLNFNELGAINRLGEKIDSEDEGNRDVETDNNNEDDENSDSKIYLPEKDDERVDNCSNS